MTKQKIGLARQVNQSSITHVKEQREKNPLHSTQSIMPFLRGLYVFYSELDVGCVSYKNFGCKANASVVSMGSGGWR